MSASADSVRCDAPPVCVTARWHNDKNVIVEAANDGPYTVAVTVRVSGPLVPGGRKDVVQTVPANSTVPVWRTQWDGVAERRPRLKYRFDWEYGAADVAHDDYIYALPYGSGQAFRILQGYGSRFSHTGNEYYSVDFGMPRGTPVHAARDGVVVELVERFGEGCWEDRCRRKANYLIILHSDGSTGEYYHLLKDGVLVALGDRVERGQKIALSGNSGHTTMPHLHFGVYEAIAWGRTRSIEVMYDTGDGRLARPRRGLKPLAR